MTTSENMKILQYKFDSDFYKIACKMLEDEEDGDVNLLSSIAEINKVRSICNTISNTKKNNMSSKQVYVLRVFVCENLDSYGNAFDEDRVLGLFNEIKTGL